MAYTAQERAEMLEKTQWMAAFAWKDIENLARYLHVTKTPAGMHVFTEGALESYMCIIVQGSVNVVKQDGEGQKKILSVITQGKTFGEMALFDGEPRSASVVAGKDAVMLVLSKENLLRLIHESPRLGAMLLFKLGTMMSQRLRMTSGKLVDYM